MAKRKFLGLHYSQGLNGKMRTCLLLDLQGGVVWGMGTVISNQQLKYHQFIFS